MAQSAPMELVGAIAIAMLHTRCAPCPSAPETHDASASTGWHASSASTSATTIWLIRFISFFDCRAGIETGM